MVAIDQRGTGADALDCPALQKQMGASDLTPPTRDAVEDCATTLGDGRRVLHHRRHRRGPRGAADRARRRQAGARRHLLRHVRRPALRARPPASASAALVLDSVVPAEGVSLLSEVSIKATGRVLGPGTTKALATVIGSEHNGPQLLDMLTALSVGAPRDDGYIDAIEQAAQRRRRRAATLAGRRREGRARLDGAASSARACTRARCARTRPRRGATRRPRSKAASRRSTRPPPSSARPTSTPTTARPRPATASRSSACTGRRSPCPAPAGPRELPDVPDAAARRRPRPLHAAGVGAAGGRARAAAAG